MKNLSDYSVLNKLKIAYNVLYLTTWLFKIY